MGDEVTDATRNAPVPDPVDGRAGGELVADPALTPAPVPAAPVPAPAPGNAPSVTLKARSEGEESTSVGGAEGLEIVAEAPFELLLKSDAGELRNVRLYSKQAGTETAVAGAAFAGTGGEGVFTFTKTDDVGTFLAKGQVVTAAATVDFVSNEVRVVRTSEGAGEGGSENDGDSVTEVAAGGEYDADFAHHTLGRMLPIIWVIVGILALISLAAVGPHLVAIVTGSAAPAWTETVRVIGQMLCIAVGLTGLLFSIWMAMLETRGRQRSPAKEPDVSGTTRGGGIGPVVVAAGELADALRRTRGLIAVLIISLLLVVVGVSWNLGDSLIPAPAPTPTPTPTSE